MRKFLVVALAVLLSSAWFSQAQAASFTFQTTPLTNLNPNGVEIQGTFSNFPARAGLYIQQCVSSLRSNTRPEDCLDLKWVTADGGVGRDSSKDVISLSLKSKYSKGLKNIDCEKEQCVLFLRFDHTAPLDRSEDLEIPITFRSTELPTSDGSAGQGSQDAVFRDPFFPIINELRIIPIIKSEINLSGEILYDLSLKVLTKIKVHRNSLAGISLTYKGPISTQENLCQSLNGTHTVGFTDLTQLGKSIIKPLSGQTSRIADGDWFVETYELEIPVNGNKDLFPCLLGSGNVLNSLLLTDISGKSKVFNSRLDGSPAPSTDSQPDVVTFKEASRQVSLQELPEYLTCGTIAGGNYSGYVRRCLDRVSRENTLIVIWKADKAAADKAAADKAAADKAAADKAAADKAAADKAAADKAAADKAKAREKTVICLKGKNALKVIGKTPKCPSGYKVKK